MGRTLLWLNTVFAIGNLLVFMAWPEPAPINLAVALLNAIVAFLLHRALRHEKET